MIKSVYVPSNKRFHNIRLENIGYDMNMSMPPAPSVKVEDYSAFVLPLDLIGEDVFFYVMNENTCYEFLKSSETSKLNIEAGTNYNVVLDFKDAVVSTLNSVRTGENGQYEVTINNVAECRHAAYKAMTYLNMGGTVNYKLAADLDFTDQYFFKFRLIG